MWPFTTGSISSFYLALYVLTWALHAVFVGYVVAGTGYALLRTVRPAPTTTLVDQVRDRLPFMLGCGITAGVAPLLFMQLLHQKRFYTANLLLGPRWMLIVPALITGFYALYLAKAARPKLRKLALAAGLGSFVFVAYAWTELHQLQLAEPAWREFYAAGKRIYFEGAMPIRLVMWLAGAVVMFAIVAAWSTAERKRLALAACAALVVTAACAAVLGARATHDVAAHGWLYLLIAAALVALAGFAHVALRPDGPGLLVATGGTTAALIAAAVVREAPRIALIEQPRAEHGGLVVFAITLVAGIGAIAWVVRTTISAPR